jgi:glyoxylase-like metal-dependent hydrolase (beta-lactamase superfamily II)
VGPFKITEGVWQVGGPEMTSPEDCCVYLVDLGAPVLIDAGAGFDTDELLHNLELAGCRPERLQALVLTHAHIDHVGGAHILAEVYGIPVIMHELDAPVLESGDDLRSAADWYRTHLRPLPVGQVLKGNGGTLPGDLSSLNWVHTPGHTPGSISLWLETGGAKVLFAQDVHGPFNQIFESDIDAWAASMHRLLDLEADLLCEGHFGIYRPAAEVRRYIESYLRQYGKA